LLQGLANTEDDAEPALERRVRFARDEFIIFGKEDAALGVAG